jgi:hypothetical protein
METCDVVCNAGGSRLSGHDHSEQFHSANRGTQPPQQQQHMVDTEQASVKLNLRLSLNCAAVTINDNCCMEMLETCLWQSDTNKWTTKKIQKSESCAGSKGPGTHESGVHGVTFLLTIFVSRVMTWQGTGGAVSGYHVPAVPCSTTGVQHNKQSAGRLSNTAEAPQQTCRQQPQRANPVVGADRQQVSQTITKQRATA